METIPAHPCINAVRDHPFDSYTTCENCDCEALHAYPCGDCNYNPDSATFQAITTDDGYWERFERWVAKRRGRAGASGASRSRCNICAPGCNCDCGEHSNPSANIDTAADHYSSNIKTG